MAGDALPCWPGFASAGELPTGLTLNRGDIGRDGP